MGKNCVFKKETNEKFHTGSTSRPDFALPCDIHKTGKIFSYKGRKDRIKNII